MCISLHELATDGIYQFHPTVEGGVGATTAFAVTAVATVCPPVALALTAVSPILLTVAGAGMIYEFFKILDDHKKQTKKYYEALTQHELTISKRLKTRYEHTKNLEFLGKAQALNTEITNRPVSTGVEGALKQYLESAAYCKLLRATPVGSKQLLGSQNSLPSSSC